MSFLRARSIAKSVNLSSNVRRFGALPRTSSLIIPGVHVQDEKTLADNLTLNINLNGISSFDLVSWTLRSHSAIGKIEGQEKEKSAQLFKPFQDLFAKVVIGKQTELPDNYLHFGDDNCAANLPLFLKTNPFFASALIAGTNAKGEVEFSLTSNRLVREKPQASDHNWFRRLVNTLDESYTRVDAKFDANMNIIAIRSYKTVHDSPATATVYEWSKSSGQAIDSKQMEESCAHLMFLLGFHSQAVHALIHVLHYMLDCAIVGATDHSPDQTCFANPYIPNVALKYLEVKLLLLSANGDLTGGLYRANHHPVPELLREMLSVWLHCATAEDFLTKFLLKDVVSNITSKQLADTKLLEQFLLHSNLAGPYATELTAAFERTQPGSIAPTDKEIKAFFADTSDRDDAMANVASLNSWIQLYSVTGIMHGGTLSFSRLLCTHPLVSLYHTGPLFKPEDTKAVTTVTGTITGMIEDHHVYSNKMHKHWINRHKFKPEVTAVMQKYADATLAYKTQHLASLKAQPEFFRRFGWIVSDYCPDGVDGKQLTLCTYI